MTVVKLRVYVFVCLVCVSKDVDVGFSQSIYSVSEADGFVQVCVILQSETQTERSVTIGITVIPETATADDFSANDETQVLFLGVGMMCFNISITSDLILEETERFSLVIVDSDPSVNVTQRSAVVIIVDSDGKYICYM